MASPLTPNVKQETDLKNRTKDALNESNIRKRLKNTKNKISYKPDDCEAMMNLITLKEKSQTKRMLRHNMLFLPKNENILHRIISLNLAHQKFTFINLLILIALTLNLKTTLFKDTNFIYFLELDKDTATVICWSYLIIIALIFISRIKILYVTDKRVLFCTSTRKVYREVYSGDIRNYAIGQNIIKESGINENAKINKNDLQIIDRHNRVYVFPIDKFYDKNKALSYIDDTVSIIKNKADAENAKESRNKMELENDEQQVTDSSEKQEFNFIIDDLGLDNIDTIENYETLETKIEDLSQTTLTQESEEK
jgi:hypothetical protein